MSAMFIYASSLTNIDGASGWDTSKVTTMAYMFRNCKNISSLNPIFDWDVTSLTTKTNMFTGIPSSVTRPGWY
jgi:surface protein